MRGKDSYIGRLHLDIGMVPSGSGIFPEYREVTGTPWEKYWALLGYTGIEEAGQREGGTYTRGSELD